MGIGRSAGATWRASESWRGQIDAWEYAWFRSCTRKTTTASRIYVQLSARARLAAETGQFRMEDARMRREAFAVRILTGFPPQSKNRDTKSGSVWGCRPKASARSARCLRG